MEGKEKSRDPDVYDLPAMVAYLKESALAGYHGRYISKPHLEDRILANHPPELYLKRSDAARRRLVTKAMNSMNLESWSGRAWWIP